MKTIGFIDHYLDEWHANHYPEWIAKASARLGKPYRVAYAYADKDAPSGLSTQQWCDKQGVRAVYAIEELVEMSDCLIVLSPDHPEQHERLAQIPLQSGKPVYIDKTFAPDLASGVRMFEMAESRATPMFSSSALRFAKEWATLCKQPGIREAAEYVATKGPGQYDNYSVHQYEMIVSLMGAGASRIKSLSTAHSRLLVIEYEDGRQASMSQMDGAAFQAGIQFASGKAVAINECSGFFEGMIDEILGFFDTGAASVPKEETLEIMALIEAGYKALDNRDSWVKVSRG